MAVARLGYLGLSSTDTSAWDRFATAQLGLMSVPGAAAAVDGDVFLKMDDHPFRLFVEQGDEDRLVATGWELDGEDAYRAAIARLEAAGVSVTAGNEAGASRRCVTEYCSTTDPAGNPVELYHGRTGVGDAFESPAGVSKFLTGDMGLGHVVVPAPNIDETHAFYRDVLGFGDSDDLTLPPPAEGAPEMRIVFLHAANPRHHSLALFNMPVPTGIVHLMFEVTSLDEVGACLDRVTAAELPLMATLGRHCNDNMVSFYVVGPGGIAVEFGYDGLQLDWSTFEPTKSTQADFWGHAYQPPV